MRLKVEQPYKSIPATEPEIDLPNLVVLSGANGAGKTHFLEAIQQGRATIASDGASDHGRHLRDTVRYVRFGALRVGNSGWDSQDDDGGIGRLLDMSFKAMGPSEALANLDQPIGDEAARRIAAQTHLIETVAERAGKSSVGELTITELRTFARPLLHGLDPLGGAFGRIFQTYVSRREAHEYRQWRHERGLAVDGGFVPIEDFEDVFGTPPWEVFTQVLDLMGLDLTFQAPTSDSTSQVSPAPLLDDRTGEGRMPSDLSTGEQTLVALASCLYAATESGGLDMPLPRTLLLDEPDAGLHPTMVSKMLTVIQDVLVVGQGVDVILTTHSPTTVALAPEESLYTIDRHRTPRLAKATRDEALGHLTVGLPTLSVRMEDRRQVFCEGKDAPLYEALYEIVTRERSWPFGLQFIPVPGSGNRSTIESVVADLRSKGVLSVFGLVDRDHKAPDTEGVFADQSVYAIENQLLNPVAIGLLLLRDHRKASALGIDAPHFQLDEAELQTLCTTVSERLAKPGEAQDHELALAGGTAVLIHPSWAERHGHTLEDPQLPEAFPPLKAYQGRLKRAVIDRVFYDVPQYVPQSLVSAFEAMST